MKILVCADKKQQDEIRSIPFHEGADVELISSFGESPDFDKYDAILFLNHLPEKELVEKLHTKWIFFNEVIQTDRYPGAARNMIRINGWPGFLERPVWEGAGDATKEAQFVIKQLGRDLIETSNIPGLISARIIACIINEAYAALHEKLSSKEEIDMAMKYGTNYPYGPFEWVQKIGEEKIHSLLLHMAEADSRYAPLFTPSNVVQ